MQQLSRIIKQIRCPENMTSLLLSIFFCLINWLSSPSLWVWSLKKYIYASQKAITIQSQQIPNAPCHFALLLPSKIVLSAYRNQVHWVKKNMCSSIQFKETRGLLHLNLNAQSKATSQNQSPEFFLPKFLSSGMMEVLYISNIIIMPVLRTPLLEGHQQPKSEINKKVGKCKMC